MGKQCANCNGSSFLVADLAGSEDAFIGCEGDL